MSTKLSAKRLQYYLRLEGKGQLAISQARELARHRGISLQADLMRKEMLAEREKNNKCISASDGGEE